MQALLELYHPIHSVFAYRRVAGRLHGIAGAGKGWCGTDGGAGRALIGSSELNFGMLAGGYYRLSDGRLWISFWLGVAL